MCPEPKLIAEPANYRNKKKSRDLKYLKNKLVETQWHTKKKSNNR